MDMGAIGGAVTALKTAADVVKTLQDVKQAAAIQSKVIELNALIASAQGDTLAAQAAQFEMADRIQKLERQLQQFENWAAEKKRYQLTDFGGGTFAYLLKPEASEGEPEHRVCPNCYQAGRKSILQFDAKMYASSRDRYGCPACKGQFEFGVRQSPSRSSYSRGRGEW